MRADSVDGGHYWCIPNNLDAYSGRAMSKKRIPGELTAEEEDERRVAFVREDSRRMGSFAIDIEEVIPGRGKHHRIRQSGGGGDAGF